MTASCRFSKTRQIDHFWHFQWTFVHSKCRIWIFQFWHFSPILSKFTCLVTVFDRKLQVFKNSPKLTIFGIFNELLTTQNINVARFARNVKWDFLSNFQTLWFQDYFSSDFVIFVHVLNIMKRVFCSSSCFLTEN